MGVVCCLVVREIVMLGFMWVVRWVVGNEANVAAILTLMVNSAVFSVIFAALISGGMRGIDCGCCLLILNRVLSLLMLLLFDGIFLLWRR